MLGKCVILQQLAYQKGHGIKAGINARLEITYSQPWAPLGQENPKMHLIGKYAVFQWAQGATNVVHVVFFSRTWVDDLWTSKLSHLLVRRPCGFQKLLCN